MTASLTGLGRPERVARDGDVGGLVEVVEGERDARAVGVGLEVVPEPQRERGDDGHDHRLEHDPEDPDVAPERRPIGGRRRRHVRMATGLRITRSADQRYGGAYSRPPSDHRRLRPRSSPSGRDVLVEDLAVVADLA